MTPKAGFVIHPLNVWGVALITGFKGTVHQMTHGTITLRMGAGKFIHLFPLKRMTTKAGRLIFRGLAKGDNQGSVGILMAAYAGYLKGKMRLFLWLMTLKTRWNSVGALGWMLNMALQARHGGSMPFSIFKDTPHLGRMTFIAIVHCE